MVVTERTGLSTRYADFIMKTSYDSLPNEVISKAKQHILDFVGVCLAGYKLMEFPKVMVNYLVSLGGTPEATIVQTKRRFPAINAALAHGACAHALDMDDGQRESTLHPGIAVIPAALAAAELSKASTKELITGIVVGYEIMLRLGMAIGFSSLRRGFHTTGTIGPFGAVAAAAKIMKLNLDETVGAFGLAGLQGAGLLAVTHDEEGAKIKSLHPAKAAMSGLFSAILASKGIKGPSAIFEGKDGFLKAYADEIRGELLTRSLGEQFEINKCYIKFYAACRHAHVQIEAALAACRNGQINPKEIGEISIETYADAIRICDTTHPTTPSLARFSIPFSVALMLLTGGAGADKFNEESVSDAEIQNLAGKIKLSLSSQWETVFPKKKGTTVTVKDVSGRVGFAEMEMPKGEPPGDPISWEDVRKKFYENATMLIPEGDAKVLANIIMNLEKASLDELTQLI